MDSPGFVWLLSHSSWFCLASTTRLVQIRNGAEHRILSIYFWTVCMDSLLVYVASFPQLLVLFGFHNLLNNINPKRSGASDFILSWFVRLFPTAPGFVRLPQLDYTNPKRSIGFHSYFCAGAVECKLRYQNEYRIRITITT